MLNAQVWIGVLLCMGLMFGCRKVDYDCNTKVSRVDSVSDPVTGDFQLDGTTDCVVGISYDSIDGSLYKVETVCEKN